MQQIITGHEDIGLQLFADFLDEAEERRLLEKIDNTAVARAKRGKTRESVRRYGSAVPYNSYIQSKMIPDYLLLFAERLVEAQLTPKIADSVSINEYLTGQIIEPHVDSKSSGKIITVMSLKSPATMLFSNLANSRQSFSVELPPRSLVQLRGDIRYLWQHSILPVPGHRYSVVFRCSADCDV
jgi:alkylated DNA repair dioxygenase AlkB